MSCILHERSMKFIILVGWSSSCSWREPCASSSRIGGNVLCIDHSRFSICLGLFSIRHDVVHDRLRTNELLLQVRITQGTLAHGVCDLSFNLGLDLCLHPCLGLGLFGSHFSDGNRLSSDLVCLSFLFDGLHLLLGSSYLGFGLL